MITRKQAMTVNRFAHIENKKKDGTPVIMRRNGKTKTWIRRPEAFRIPVKLGLYSFGYIHHSDAHMWYDADQKDNLSIRVKQLYEEAVGLAGGNSDIFRQAYVNVKLMKEHADLVEGLTKEEVREIIRNAKKEKAL